MLPKYRELDFTALLAEIRSNVDSNGVTSDAMESATVVLTKGIQRFINESNVALAQLESDYGNAIALTRTREMNCLPVDAN